MAEAGRKFLRLMEFSPAERGIEYACKRKVSNVFRTEWSLRSDIRGEGLCAFLDKLAELVLQREKAGISSASRPSDSGFLIMYQQECKR